jgi:hypothetical protein
MRRHDPQPVPRTLALRPQLIAGAAEECHVPCLQRPLQRLTIHKAHHQDFPVAGVLHHGRKQPAHFVEVKFCIHTPTRFLGATKSPLNVFRVSGPKLLKSAGYFTSAISGAHRRHRAMRVMVMMAVMEVRRHIFDNHTRNGSSGSITLIVSFIRFLNASDLTFAFLDRESRNPSCCDSLHHPRCITFVFWNG